MTTDYVELDDAHINNLVNYEDIKTMCAICNQFYSNDNSIYCSQCKIIKEHKDSQKQLSLDDIINLENGTLLKHNLINDNLIPLFNRYCTENKIKHVLLNNDIKFNILKNSCIDPSITPLKLLQILEGQKDFPPTVLLAKYTDQLLEVLGDKIDKDCKYIHLLCTFTIDRWNITNTNSVLICYWANRSNIRPYSITALHILWNTIICRPEYSTLGGFLNVCEVCNKDMIIYDGKSGLIRCKSCYKFIHLACVNSSLCPCCKHNWVIHPKSDYDLGDICYYV